MSNKKRKEKRWQRNKFNRIMSERFKSTGICYKDADFHSHASVVEFGHPILCPKCKNQAFYREKTKGYNSYLDEYKVISCGYCNFYSDPSYY